MTQQTFRLPASGAHPSLFVRRQPLIGAPAVLYVHGATFPSALSVGFDFGGGSWLDDWHTRGFDAWAFDFAGFGESGRYDAMSEPADRHPPLGRAPDAANQIAAVLALIRRETGRPCVSLVSHTRVSTIDVGGNDFVLMAGAKGTAWIDATADGDPPMKSLQIGDARWCESYGVEDDGAVLVRPDGYVAWRSAAMTVDPSRSLGEALASVKGFPR
jgi:hypothetical protein